MNDIKIIDNFLDGREFRNYVDGLLMKKGYANVSIDDPRLTDKSKKNDNDLLAEKDGIKYTVQTFLNTSITEKEIKEAISDIKKEKADRAIIITNRDADKTVKKIASEKNVDIWDRKVLRKYIYIDEIFEFLKESGMFFIATIDDDKPRVRPFGAVNIFEDRLYIQTGKKKLVSKQIEKNPNVEICSFNKGKWIRIEGVLVRDERIEAKKAMLNAYPDLKKMYSADDDNTEVLYFKKAKATIYSFTDKPVVINI